MPKGQPLDQWMQAAQGGGGGVMGMGATMLGNVSISNTMPAIYTNAATVAH